MMADSSQLQPWHMRIPPSSTAAAAGHYDFQPRWRCVDASCARGSTSVLLRLSPSSASSHVAEQGACEACELLCLVGRCVSQRSDVHSLASTSSSSVASTSSSSVASTPSTSPAAAVVSLLSAEERVAADGVGRCKGRQPRTSVLVTALPVVAVG